MEYLTEGWEASRLRQLISKTLSPERRERWIAEPEHDDMYVFPYFLDVIFYLWKDKSDQILLSCIKRPFISFEYGSFDFTFDTDQPEIKAGLSYLWEIVSKEHD